MNPELRQNFRMKFRLIISLAMVVVVLLAMFTVDEANAVIYKIPLVYSGSHGRSKRFISSDASHLNNLLGKPGQGYYIAVHIGTPPQRLNVLVDTGSSNFAIASYANPFIQKFFHPNDSTTFSYNGTEVYVPYTQGKWEGLLANDIVSIPSAGDLLVRVDLACITKSERFFLNGSNWQGILGLAYSSLARPNSLVTPFFDTLVAVKSVSNVFSMQLCGESHDFKSIDGTLIIGGMDPTLYTGEITYTPLHREWYYEIILTGLEVGDIPVQIDCKELNSDKTIVDSGTMSLRLPRKVFGMVVDILKRQSNTFGEQIPEDFWNGDGAMCWSAEFSPTDVFPRLKISVAHSQNATFILSIPPHQYLWEYREAHSALATFNCYKFAINPSDTGTVLGAVIMEGFYLIFDRQNKRLGFAQSSCNSHMAGRNIKSVILGPFPSQDPMKCSYVPPTATDNRTLVHVAYVMAGLCGLGLITMLVFYIKSALLARKRSTDIRGDTSVSNLFQADS